MSSAFEAFALQNLSHFKSESKKPKLSLLKWHIIPKLQPTDACCSQPFDRNFRSVQEYFHVLDFEAHGERQSREYRAKFSFVRPFQCFGSGHLRAARITARTYIASDGKRFLVLFAGNYLDEISVIKSLFCGLEIDERWYESVSIRKYNKKLRI